MMKKSAIKPHKPTNVRNPSLSFSYRWGNSPSRTKIPSQTPSSHRHTRANLGKPCKKKPQSFAFRLYMLHKCDSLPRSRVPHESRQARRAAAIGRERHCAVISSLTISFVLHGFFVRGWDIRDGVNWMSRRGLIARLPRYHAATLSPVA